jgi:hypothetical protein
VADYAECSVIARKPFMCEGYRCRYTIKAGETYARLVAFPSRMSEVNQGTAPLVLRICQTCQEPKPMPPRRRRKAARDTHTEETDQ